MSAAGRECLQWVPRGDVGSYGQRWGHAMAYDSDRGVTVFFGGERGTDGAREYFDDTWEYDGTSWKRITVGETKPSPRSFHAMAYDPVRKRIMLHGGENWNVDDEVVSLSDTWVYVNDGGNASWTRLNGSSPSLDPSFTRSGHAMVFDSKQQRMVVLEGTEVCRGDCGLRWVPTVMEWHEHGQSDGEWIDPSLGGHIGNDWGVGAAFDDSRGLALGVTGYFDSGIWDPLNPDLHFAWAFTTEYEFSSSSPSIRSGPHLHSPRRLVAMAYDSFRQRVVMVGGEAPPWAGQDQIGEEAYEFHAETADGWVALPRLPSGQGRSGARMVYDSRRRVMVLTGGAGGGAPDWENGGRYSDTWELVPVPLPDLYVTPADAQGDVCGPATLDLKAMGETGLQDLGNLRFQWRLDGVPLRDDAQLHGVTTSRLTIDPLRHGHAGRYDVVVSDECNTAVTSRVSILTVNPGLQWVFRTTNGPAARNGHTMAYDSYRRKTLLFGGRRIVSSSGPNGAVVEGLNDLWEWDGTSWRQRLASTKTNGWTYSTEAGQWRPSYTNRPVQRVFHAMAYDTRRDRLVVFGGYPIDPTGWMSPTALGDLWEWDGTDWHFLGTHGPAPRARASMAYDAHHGLLTDRRGRMVLFGGVLNGSDENPLATWEWDGSTWERRAEFPGTPRYYEERGRMVYDPSRGAVVYGPVVSSAETWHFWKWNGQSWSGFPPGQTTDPVVQLLSGLEHGAMAFDQARRRTVWFGGVDGPVRNETAFFDGANWTLLRSSGGPLPAPRTDTAVAYDPLRQVTVLFGGDPLGYDATLSTNDTWELAAIDTPMVTQAPTNQPLRVGQVTRFRVAALGGLPTYQWYRTDGRVQSALSDTDRFLGTQSDTLTILNTQVIDEGSYYVVLRNQCGTTTTQPVDLESNPRFAVRSSPGFGFGADYQEGRVIVVWPEANAILEQAPRVTGPWQVVEGATSPFMPGAGAQAGFFRLRFDLEQ